MIENWKPIQNYEDYYAISDLVRVKRIKSGPSTKVGKILKAACDPQGYRFVVLCKEGKTKPIRVHLLVARAFIGPPNGLAVNHKDLDKDNNALSNLEYVTPQQNTSHAFLNGALARNNVGRFVSGPR